MAPSDTCPIGMHNVGLRDVGIRSCAPGRQRGQLCSRRTGPGSSPPWDAWQLWCSSCRRRGAYPRPPVSTRSRSGDRECSWAGRCCCKMATSHCGTVHSRERHRSMSSVAGRYHRRGTGTATERRYASSRRRYRCVDGSGWTGCKVRSSLLVLTAYKLLPEV